jgi:predicted SprT family Zn-dependent metalloprotease
MSEERYVAENFDYQHRSGKILNNLKDKIMKLELEMIRIKEELSKYKDKCECGGELVLDKELNSNPKMFVYNCNKCHENILKRE